MHKKILILCTGNSCRSILAEAMINSYLDGADGYSAGVKASGKVNKNAIKLLRHHNIWDKNYHSKTLKKLKVIDFDLVVTVCDNARESCPVFPEKVHTVHIGFEDPDGKEYPAFEETMNLMHERLLPELKKLLVL